MVGLVFVTVVITRMYSQIHELYKGYDTREQFVEIQRGAQANTIGQLLVDAGVVSGPWIFRLALWWSESEHRLQAGEYHFDRPLTSIEVVDQLLRGQVYVRPITFPEGLTIREMAKVFEKEGLGQAETFIRVSNHHELIAEFDNEASNLEGYLFPDTYALPRNVTAYDIVR